MSKYAQVVPIPRGENIYLVYVEEVPETSYRSSYNYSLPPKQAEGLTVEEQASILVEASKKHRDAKTLDHMRKQLEG